METIRGEKDTMAKKPTNRIYQVYELRDSIRGAIENITKLVEHQRALVSCIKASPEYNDETFKDFVEGIEHDANEHEGRLTGLRERLACCDLLVELHEKGGEEGAISDRAVTKLLEALKLDQPEPTEA